MRILVTGICGRLGQGLVRLAPRFSHQFVGVDRVDWPEDAGPLPPNVCVHRGCYRDRDHLEALLPGCHGLIHTAGPHGGHVHDQTLKQFLDANVTDVAQLLEAARHHGVQSVALSSTMEVVIGPEWSGHGPTVLDETVAPRPGSAYPISRYAMEAMARAFAMRHGDLSIALLRFMAFGYRPDDQLGPSLLGRALSPLDAAAAAVNAVERRGFMGEVFHIGPDTPVTEPIITQALDDPQGVLERLYPGAAAILEKHDRPIAARNFWPVADITKARRLLNYQPRITFETWLADKGWRRPGTKTSSPAVTVTQLATRTTAKPNSELC